MVVVLPVVRSFGQIGGIGGDQQFVNDISEFDDIPVTPSADCRPTSGRMRRKAPILWIQYPIAACFLPYLGK